MKKSQIKLLGMSLLCCFCFCFGCIEPRQMSKWDIIITSPSGESHKYTVMSYDKPRPYPLSGGQTGVMDAGYGSYHEWERQIVAPAGWMVTVETASE